MSDLTNLKIMELLSRSMIDITKDYFDEMTSTKVVVGSPFLNNNGEKLQRDDFYSTISILGECRGIMVISASEKMLKDLTSFIALTNEIELDEAMLQFYYKDVIGEMSNVLAGNSKKVLGDEFVITVPTVDNVINFNLPQGTITLPINWKEHKFNISFNFFGMTESVAL